MSRIYTIPAGLSFVDVLAQGILDDAKGDPLTLARIQILLPTRRGCRSLREAFLRLSEGKPLLLPRMNPIGDVDEEELLLTLAGIEDDLSLPPAMPSLQRQILLSRLIAARGHGRGIEQDMALAATLGRLMDQVYTEDLDLANLPNIVDRDNFANHWQISLDFLELLSKFWPLILEENSMIDTADRRNRLVKRLAKHWAENPPTHKIIAAGSTGSIPATASLLKTVANLPDGCIVLPGLDQIMDDESWASIDDTHPQATLRHLLSELDTDRKQVIVWPSCGEDTAQKKHIRALTSEIMRPSETAQKWQTIGDRFTLSPEELTIERYDCANSQEEALAIAAALRRVLEDKTKTAALVTPDRKLARRVAMTCRRWGIEIDDSGGQALSETRVGIYLRLCMETLCAEMKPVALLDFCKNALCLPSAYTDWRQDIRRLDATIFRGPAFQGGIESYERKIAEWAQKNDASHLQVTIDFIAGAFAPLLALQTIATPLPFEQWCEAHLRVAQNFCDAGILWSGQDGESAAAFLADLREHSALLPPVSGEEYLALLQLAMAGIAIRPAFGLHPRLMILGQLEARLVEVDVMILSGLNEGTWPPKPVIDPWMSRPMRKRFGLPPLERSIGLAAHDFAQSLCADMVVITRAVRVDGTPTVPSRWLQRMDTVIQACGYDPAILQSGPLLAQVRMLDHTKDYKPVERPAPRPPVAARPRRLSVTKIDTWMNDPYSIYARYILRLEPLKPLEQSLDAAMRGTLIHEVLERFSIAIHDAIPPDAEKLFMTIAREELNRLSLEADVKSFWEPRLSKISSWIVGTEKSWREDMMPYKREVKGKMDFTGPAGTFTLSSRADRIDRSRDGTSGAIIDYKSGGTYTPKGMKNGTYPQLPLESLILEDGGFEDGTGALETTVLSYWIVNGSKDGGTIKEIKSPSDLAEAKQNAHEGLQQLIDIFDSETTPYYSLPRPEKAPRYNDYEHLARVREWTALDEQEEDAA